MSKNKDEEIAELKKVLETLEDYVDIDKLPDELKDVLAGLASADSVASINTGHIPTFDFGHNHENNNCIHCGKTIEDHGSLFCNMAHPKRDGNGFIKFGKDGNPKASLDEAFSELVEPSQTDKLLVEAGLIREIDSKTNTATWQLPNSLEEEIDSQLEMTINQSMSQRKLDAHYLVEECAKKGMVENTTSAKEKQTKELLQLNDGDFDIFKKSVKAGSFGSERPEVKGSEPGTPAQKENRKIKKSKGFVNRAGIPITEHEYYKAKFDKVKEFEIDISKTLNQFFTIKDRKLSLDVETVSNVFELNILLMDVVMDGSLMNSEQKSQFVNTLRGELVKMALRKIGQSVLFNEKKTA